MLHDQSDGHWVHVEFESKARRAGADRGSREWPQVCKSFSFWSQCVNSRCKRSTDQSLHCRAGL